MKRIVSTALLLVTLLLPLSMMTSCSDEPDRKGEWGAYYEALLSYEKDFAKGTRYLCIDYANIEEENQKGLYDLLYYYCKERKMSVVEGGWSTLYGMRLLSDDSEFTDGYMISFTSVNWSKDRGEVSVVLSLKRYADLHGDNLGGSVTVTQSSNGWKANRLDKSKEMEGKAGAYYAVFDYFVKEAGMSGLKTVLALDPAGVEMDILSDLKVMLTSYAGSQGYRFMEGDWEGLKQNGYVDASGVFNEGYLFDYDEVSWNAKGDEVTITAWMKEGDMRALGGVFTVKRQTNTWQIADVKTMMS